MARIYANSVEKGLKNLNDVPTKLRNSVEEIIIADGYKINPDGTVSKE